MPWILDVGYTVMCVALMLAVMGHILFGDFEVTMFTLPESISGRKAPSTPPSCLSDHLLNGTILLPVTQDYVSTAAIQCTFDDDDNHTNNNSNNNNNNHNSNAFQLMMT